MSADPVLVDSNVVFDVLTDDPTWRAWSLESMNALADRLAINPMIYAEFCYGRESRQEIDDLIESMGLRYLELPKPALFLASRAFKAYRERGGTRTAPLADFFIGAHAQVIGAPILTRDTGRYRTYFPTVALIAP